MNKSVCTIHLGRFSGVVAIDPITNIPRVYLTLYAVSHLSGLAVSTQLKSLRGISRVYDFCRYTHNCSLDDLLANGDFTAISNVMEQFYINILNDPNTSSQRASKIWAAVRRFIDLTTKRLLPSYIDSNTLDWPRIQLKYEHMQAVYSQLQAPKHRIKSLPMRALSTEAVEAIFEIIRVSVNIQDKLSTS